MIRNLSLAVLALHFAGALALGQIFTPTTPPSDEPAIAPATAEIFQVDEPALRAALEGQTSLALPIGKGEILALSIRPHATMAPELERQFPNIRTYIGESPGGEVAHLDFTAQGFHAMILRPSGSTVFIDPWHHPVSRGVYQIYTRDDFAAGHSGERFNCLVADEGRTVFPPRKQMAPAPVPRAAAQPGEQLRTYRLALACTGEYAQFHGGTTAGALSAMVTTMNRVNGVYERDVAIHMDIIANNNLIIYLNGATDPYTNNSGSTMLNENQTNCDAVIGSSNYDIGHVFSTGGGGIAQLNGPCGSGKARGVTGGGSPVGDPFDIDYVAHEIGHQFGANHTQNNPCNRASSAAYEPGSASTIMGYAGICSPNLQSNSDDHFHNHSINEMINFSVNGNGNSCPVITTTGNTAPTVEAGVNGLTIPANTPFELTATGFDSDGDDLTYNWEEYDLGPATAAGDNNLTNPSGTQPIFRSWSSDVSPTRVFPRIPDLVNGSSTIGELLPTYSRAMNFKCTVKDNVAGGGAMGQDLLSFQVDGNSGPFEVLTPNGGSAVAPGAPMVVSWAVAGTDGAPINCTAVDIWLSTDGGYTFDELLASSVANDGAETVVLPNISSNTARIKVKASGNHFFDISDGNFVIDPTLNPVDNDLGVSDLVGLPSGGCGSTFAPAATVTNYGLVTATAFDLSFILHVDGAAMPDTLTVNWTGTLALGGTVSISACDAGCFDVPAGTSGQMEVILLPPASDENPANQFLSSPFESGSGVPVSLTIATDCWGGEVGWTLVDEAGTVVMEVASGTLSSNSTTVTDICLSDGCYTFNITDAYGDGMNGSQWSSCDIDGDYAMTGPDGGVLFAMETAAYGDGTSHAFCLETGVDCAADLDGNGAVDVGDLLLLLADFGCQTNCTADIDSDGLVGVTDVLALLGEFSATCN